MVFAGMVGRSVLWGRLLSTAAGRCAQPDSCGPGELLVIDGPEVGFADRGAAEHGDGRQFSLPVRSVEVLAHELHFSGVESATGELPGRVPIEQPIQDHVGLRVADAEITLVRLSGDEIGGRRLVDDLPRYGE